MTTQTPDPGVPPDYDPGQFPAFAVTVDMVILTMSDSRLHVLLVQRGVPPFEGMWAIPGGFKRPTETLDEAAQRELAEETGVDAAGLLTQFGAYGDPERDPRMNVVTIGYLAVLRAVDGVVAGTDAAGAALVPVSDALEGTIELAFDHDRIVRDAVERVRVDLELRGIATAFVGTTFTLAELRAVYEAVWGVQLDSANFRRSLLSDAGWVIPTGRRASRARPAASRRSCSAPGGCGGTAARSGIRRPASREGGEMRAVVYDRYGPPEVLRLEDVERPVPGEDQLLVRIHATTVNRTDCGFRSAEFFVTRFFTGVVRPKQRIPGIEFAGVVEATGGAVTEFEVGDRVFGVTSAGAHAEFTCIREASPVAHMPAGMSFEDAAAACDGASLALACLRKAGSLDGKSLLVYGASGAVGTAAVQLAKHFGAYVTAVSSSKAVELVRSLGADEVIDYTRDDFTKNGNTYDVVFDAVGKHSFRRCRHSLKPGGTFMDTDPGFMWHVLPLSLADALGRRQDGGTRDHALREAGRRAAEAADRGGRVPACRRPALSARGCR